MIQKLNKKRFFVKKRYGGRASHFKKIYFGKRPTFFKLKRGFKRPRRYKSTKKYFLKSLALSRPGRIQQTRRKLPTSFNWFPKRKFSRATKVKKSIFFAKERRRKYLRRNNWSSRIKSGRYARPPRMFAASPFRYQLFNTYNNTKKFKFWLETRFAARRSRFMFRMFYFFRKLERIKISLNQKYPRNPKYKVDSTFFDRYRKFSFWSLKYAYPRFFKRFKKKFFRFKTARKGFKKYPNYSFRSRQFRLIRVLESSFYFPRKRKFCRSTTKRKVAYNKFASFFSEKIKFYNFSNRFGNKPAILIKSQLLQSGTFPKFSKIFKIRRSYKRKPVFQSFARVPRTAFKNLLVKKKFPFSYFFTRSAKKLKVFLKAFRRKKFIKNRFRRFSPHEKRLYYRLRFYHARFKRLGVSKKPRIRRFFFVRKKYAKFHPYLGYFRNFGKSFFKHKRRRLRFFRFFRRYFALSRRFSGVATPKLIKHKRIFRRIKIFAHIFRSVNNMFVTISAPRGRSLYSYSAGRTHFRGSKRLSPIAIETMGKSISVLLKSTKIKSVAVVFHTPVDFLVRSLLRGLRSSIAFSSFRYYMNKPHNGLRLRASRRV